MISVQMPEVVTAEVAANRSNRKRKLDLNLAEDELIDSISSDNPVSKLAKIDINQSGAFSSNTVSANGTPFLNNATAFDTEALYKTLVNNALKEIDNQNYDNLNSLTARLSVPRSSAEALSSIQLLFIIRALTTDISRLDNPCCSSLITAVIKIKWKSQSPEFITAYTRFLQVLISGIPKWWSSVADKMVAEFTGYDTQTCHSVLQHILRLIPTSTNALSSVLAKNFPHKSDDSKAINNYVTNLLRVNAYCPEFRAKVWGLIVEHVVKLDVELQDEIDEDDDEDEDEDEDEDSDMQSDAGDGFEPVLIIASPDSPDYIDDNDEQTDDDKDGFSDSEISEYNVDDNETNVKLLRSKLDSLFGILLDHLDTQFTDQELVNGDAVSLFNILLDLFKTYILPTHKTRSAQYLIFSVVHSHPDLLDSFLVSLIELALSSTENIEKRLKAMQYVSSFVARARGLSRTQIVSVVSLLTNWLDRYVKEREMEVDTIGSMARFKMFYATTQALFYIFCFRHSILRTSSRDPSEPGPSHQEWECDVDKFFQRIIVTKFNPLRYCQKTVVAMFARIAQVEDATYCFSIMEQNRLGRSIKTPPALPSAQPSYFTLGHAASTASVNGFTWGTNQEFVSLDSSFPFDPVILPKARKRFASIYIEWSDVADDSSDLESDEED